MDKEEEIDVKRWAVNMYMRAVNNMPNSHPAQWDKLVALYRIHRASHPLPPNTAEPIPEPPSC